LSVYPQANTYKHLTPHRPTAAKDEDEEAKAATAEAAATEKAETRGKAEARDAQHTVEARDVEARRKTHPKHQPSPKKPVDDTQTRDPQQSPTKRAIAADLSFSNETTSPKTAQ
jgi:hypothetical protein